MMYRSDRVLRVAESSTFRNFIFLMDAVFVLFSQGLLTTIMDSLLIVRDKRGKVVKIVITIMTPP